MHQSSTVHFELMTAWRRWKDPPPAELLHSVAASTAGFAGADLAALCSAAVHAAVRRTAPALLEQLDRRVAALPDPDDVQDFAAGSGGAPSVPPASDGGEPALGSLPQVPAAQAANDGADHVPGPGKNPADLPPSVAAPRDEADQLQQSAQEAPPSAAPCLVLPSAEDTQAAQTAPHTAVAAPAGHDEALLDAVQVRAMTLGSMMCHM